VSERIRQKLVRNQIEFLESKNKTGKIECLKGSSHTGEDKLRSYPECIRTRGWGIRV
jgi:hypothetical protein